MKEYRDIVKEVLAEGNYKPNRTGVDTISKFGVSYTIDRPEDEFPLLTTKRMDGGRWESLVRELLWYLSGEPHIRNLSEHTAIWDAWADETGMLDTAYGRFWRNYPSAPTHNQHIGETWESNNSDVEDRDGVDQIQYIIDTLNENPNSRRLVLNAWHPANAIESTLPPCHLMAIFNVQNGDILNLHLTQRSGDMALGVPFNIASYSLLQRLIAAQTGLSIGRFHHTIVDAHVYCGQGERGRVYNAASQSSDFRKCIEKEHWNSAMRVINRLSLDSTRNRIPDSYYDHVPRLIEQLQRDPLPLPQVEIADKDLDELTFEDFELKNYHRYDSLRFDVAE